MNPNDLATKYRLLNSSFKKTMIYHIGIDAGFFTEYTGQSENPVDMLC